ncbi:MAG: hypothetical protein V4637_18230, partial [Pseudomonadota bacterium]
CSQKTTAAQKKPLLLLKDMVALFAAAPTLNLFAPLARLLSNSPPPLTLLVSPNLAKLDPAKPPAPLVSSGLAGSLSIAASLSPSLSALS